MTKRRKHPPTVQGETLGTFIRSERHRIGLSQREVAERLGIDHTYLSHLEADRRVPSLALLRNLAGVTLRPITITIRAE